MDLKMLREWYGYGTRLNKVWLCNFSYGGAPLSCDSPSWAQGCTIRPQVIPARLRSTNFAYEAWRSSWVSWVIPQVHAKHRVHNAMLLFLQKCNNTTRSIQRFNRLHEKWSNVINCTLNYPITLAVRDEYIRVVEHMSFKFWSALHHALRTFLKLPPIFYGSMMKRSVSYSIRSRV